MNVSVLKGGRNLRPASGYDSMSPCSSKWSNHIVFWPDKASKASGGGPLQI